VVGDLLADPLTHRVQVGRRQQDQDGELLTAEPDDQVVGSDAGPDDLADLVDHLVTDGVPVPVVDPFEVIDVDPDRQAGLLLARQQRRDLGLRAPTVGDLGERIGAGVRPRDGDGPFQPVAQRQDLQRRTDRGERQRQGLEHRGDRAQAEQPLAQPAADGRHQGLGDHHPPRPIQSEHHRRQREEHRVGPPVGGQAQHACHDAHQVRCTYPGTAKVPSASSPPALRIGITTCDGTVATCR
jgi:hypothetical protein